MSTPKFCPPFSNRTIEICLPLGFKPIHQCARRHGDFARQARDVSHRENKTKKCQTYLQGGINIWREFLRMQPWKTDHAGPHVNPRVGGEEGMEEVDACIHALGLGDRCQSPCRTHCIAGGGEHILLSCDAIDAQECRFLALWSKSSSFLRLVSVRPWPSWFHRLLRLQGSHIQLLFRHP